jgi:hypothetical protein
MPEETTPEVSPVRLEIDRLRGSKAVTDPFHPSHEAALRTLSELYSQAYPEVEMPSETPTEVVGERPSEPHAKIDALDNPLTPEEGQAIASLQQEWGSSWQANVEAAQGVVESLSKDLGADVADFLEDSRLGSHPIVITDPAIKI